MPYSLAIPAAQKIERAFQWVQGKGWPTNTIRSEIRAVLGLLPLQDAVVLDIGANRGDWSRHLLKRAGSRISRLYAFEPGSGMRRKLQTISFPAFEIVPRAVSDESASSVLYGSTDAPGLSSLHQRRLEHFGMHHEPLEEVETITLDDFFGEQGLLRADFVKLDIEGHEIHALNGAVKTLRSGAIRALSFEFGGCNIDSRTFFRDFWYFFADLGFRIYRLTPLGTLYPIRRYSEDLETFRATTYFATCVEADLPPASGQ